MTALQHFPYIFTFYSYKGGVGRSMSLLNSAFELAGRGRHVLILDMDLEAPGISNFLFRSKEFQHPPQKDIIELLKDVLNFEKQGGHFKEAAAHIQGISQYISPIKEKKLPPPKSRIGESGRIDVVPALVQDQSYWSRLAELNLGSCSQKTLQKTGLILKHYLKAQRFSISPPSLKEIGEEMQVPYDYVFIDSRTGITESGGLCIGPLADRLVILTSLNDQNINGTKDMMKVSGIHPGKKTSGKKWDEGEPDITDNNRPPLMGPKPTLLVASPVPSGEILYKRQRLAILNEQLGPHAAQLSYHPQMALMESIFVRDYPEEYLSFEYQTLVNQILASASDSSPHLAEASRKAFKDEDIASAIQALLRLYFNDGNLGIQFLKQFHNTIADISMHSGRRFTGNEFRALYQMYYYLNQADPKDIVSLNAWGIILSDLAIFKQGKEAGSLFDLAYQKFELALKIKPDDHETLYNWGTALSDQAKSKQENQADSLFNLAYQKYELALKIKPDKHEALNNWGNALLAQAKSKQGNQADSLFDLAYQKYELALKIKPDDHEALNNWGAALSDQAKSKQGKEADSLFSLACQKYELALKIKPDKHEALYNWGTALSDQAKSKQGLEADSLFDLACQKYELALKIKPDKHEALNNWGTALSDQAKSKQGHEADSLFDLAYKKFEQALIIKPDNDSTLFNIACWMALHNQTESAIQNLKRMKTTGPALAKQIREESDFEKIINQPLFQAFLAGLESNPSHA